MEKKYLTELYSAIEYRIGSKLYKYKQMLKTGDLFDDLPDEDYDWEPEQCRIPVVVPHFAEDQGEDPLVVTSTGIYHRLEEMNRLCDENHDSASYNLSKMKYISQQGEYHVGQAITDILDLLEKRYDIDFAELEANYLNTHDRNVNKIK